MIQTLPLVIQTNDKNTATHLCRAFEADVRVHITSVVRAAQTAYEEVVRQRPAIVLLTVGAQPQITWDLCQAIRQISPETAVICAAQQASPDLILDTLRNGAHEFLRIPVRPEELHTVLNRIVESKVQNTQSAPVTGKRGRVVAVFSPRGGCGTSFIATNVAVSLNAPTVIADLNLQASSQDLYLGVKPRFSWVDLVENRARLDEQMLGSLLVPVNERLSLLAAPAKAEDAELVTPEQLHSALTALQDRFDFVVLDAMHTFDALTLSALDLADDILLVVGMDIASVRAAQRAMTIFQRLHYPPEKIRLVLNRWSKDSDLELREIERALGQNIQSLISDDYRTVVTSLNLGKPLLANAQPGQLGSELQKLLDSCGLPFVGQLNSSKRGLLDVLLRRNTAALPAPAAAPNNNTSQSFPALSAPRKTPVPFPPNTTAALRLKSAPENLETESPLQTETLKTF